MKQRRNRGGTLALTALLLMLGFQNCGPSYQVNEESQDSGVALQSSQLGPSPTPGVTPSPSPVATATPAPSATPSATPTVTPKPSPTPSATATPTPKPTATPSPTPVATATPQPTATPTPSPAARATPMIGVYRGEAYNRSWVVQSYSDWLGLDIMLAQGHQAKDTWASIENPSWQLVSWGNWVKGKPGRRLNYSVSLFPTGKGTLAECAAGKYNASYTKLANNMVAQGLQKTIIRPGWEFSGNWMPWYSGGKEADFAGCFRQFVTAMRSAQPNAGFEFDWNPNYDISSSAMAAAYPGDAYVDYVGLDMYDQGWDTTYQFPVDCDLTCQDQRRLKLWNQVFGPALNKFKNFAKSHGKPVSIPEWGLDPLNKHGGGDNRVFIQKMIEFARDPANNVAYFSYFDVQASDGHHQLSDVDGSGGHTFVTEFPLASALFKTLLRP